MALKETTNGVVESTKYLINFSDNPGEIIAGICATHKLTEEFVQEFKKYITPEMFMTSHRLTASLADAFPSLFNEEEFKELMKYQEFEVDKKDVLQRNFNCAVTDPRNQVNKVAAMVAAAEDNDTKKVSINKLTDASISMISRYIDCFKNTDEYALDEDCIINAIRDADGSDELADIDVVFPLMGFSGKVDDLLLRRITDDNVRTQLLLAISVSSDIDLSAESYRYLTSEMKEDILGTEDVNVKEFIKALSDTNDIGWVYTMIDKAANGELKFIPTPEVMDEDILTLLGTLPEQYIIKFTKLSNVILNGFSYKVMNWLLSQRTFTEDQLIELKDLFKRAGLFMALRNIATENNYTKLLSVLK